MCTSSRVCVCENLRGKVPRLPQCVCDRIGELSVLSIEGAFENRAVVVHCWRLHCLI